MKEVKRCINLNCGNFLGIEIIGTRKSILQDQGRNSRYLFCSVEYECPNCGFTWRTYWTRPHRDSFYESMFHERS